MQSVRSTSGLVTSVKYAVRRVWSVMRQNSNGNIQVQSVTVISDTQGVREFIAIADMVAARSGKAFIHKKV